jgi:hypothetical protein
MMSTLLYWQNHWNPQFIVLIVRQLPADKNMNMELEQSPVSEAAT